MDHSFESSRSPNKRHCIQCSILKQRMKKQFDQSFGRNTSNTSHSRSSTPTRIHSKSLTILGDNSIEKLSNSTMSTSIYQMNKHTDDANKMPTNISRSTFISKMAFFLSFPIISIFYLIILIFNYIVINHIQHEEFIDEIFHIPQARQYCDGNFSHWDNKITTPPGLYIISYTLLKPLNLCSQICSLRFINILFSFGNFLLIYRIFNLKKTGSFEKEHELILVQSLSLSLLPPLFFFSFLYYTDSGSMFLILLSYYLAKVDHHTIAACSGFMSLFFRQNNIVWIFFIAACKSIKITSQLYSEVYTYQKLSFVLFWRQIHFRCGECSLKNGKYLFCVIVELVKQIFKSCFAYLIVGLGFVTFLIWNQGIVLGDRSAHQPVIHLAQLPYFLTFVFIFGFPLLLSDIVSLGKIYPKHIKWVTLVAIMLYICLTPLFTFVHPYLLADSRHYVFYLWKRFWYRQDGWTRYMAIPLYTFTLLSMLVLSRFPLPIGSYHKRILPFVPSQIVKVIFAFCTLVTIIPQSLIEFRYFLVPYIFWRLNIRPTLKLTTVMLELSLMIIVNVITVAIFSFKTFQFDNSTTAQRIIW